MSLGVISLIWIKTNNFILLQISIVHSVSDESFTTHILPPGLTADNLLDMIHLYQILALVRKEFSIPPQFFLSSFGVPLPLRQRSWL